MRILVEPFGAQVVTFFSLEVLFLRCEQRVGLPLVHEGRDAPFLNASRKCFIFSGTLGSSA
jgi:hypothetical protein